MNEENGNGKQGLEIVENEEFGKVRIISHEGQYLFAGKDVAKALGYKRPENAVTQHCKGILKLGIPSAGGTQETRFITEGDVYRLIIRSKLPGAQRFEAWVFDEVLPEIRKKGMYATADLLAQVKRNPDIIYKLAEEMLKERKQNEFLMKKLVDAGPKAQYYDAFVNPTDCSNVRTTAKQLMVPEKRFVRFLISNGYLYRAPSGKLMPYAVQGNSILFVVRDFYNNGFLGSYTLITPAGKSLFLGLRDQILEVEG